MQSSPTVARRRLCADLFLLTLLIGGAYLALLGHRPLAVPSEARYAEIPREMVATGDWLTPRLNGVKYFEKPPLFYWLQALAMTAFGQSEFVARLWTAIFGLGGCLAVYITGARLWTRRAGLLAAATMGTSLLYFELSRQILLDMPVTFFLTVALAAFLLAVRAPPDSRARARALYLMYAMAAAATLTKGLIGIVLPGLVVFVWLLVTGRWSELRHARLVSGTLLFLAIAAPWHIAVGLKNPEFFWFYFVHEHVLRFITPEAGRNQPIWFFVPILIAGWLPWIVLLPAAVTDAVRAWRADRARHATEVFLLLWFALPFLFFSASHSKLIPYALPLFPPLALLLGAWLDRALDGPAKSLRVSLGALAIVLLGLGLAAGVLRLTPETVVPEKYVANVVPMFTYLNALAGGFVVVGLAVALAAWRQAGRVAVAITLAASAVFGLAVDSIVGHVQPRSVKALAEIVNQRRQPGDEVAAIFTYDQDLPFYLNQLVTVAATGGDELEFGRSVEDVSGWMIGEPEFWRRWARTDRTMYAVLSLQHLVKLAPDQRRLMFEIARTRSEVLVVNRPPG